MQTLQIINANIWETDAYFLLRIILIIAFTVIWHNWHYELQSVSGVGNSYQMHLTLLGANRSLCLNRLCHIPLSDRRKSHNIYYSNYDASKIFSKAKRPSLLHSLDQLYATSYDEYSVAFVPLHHCTNKMIWINKLAKVAPTLFFGVHRLRHLE